MSEKQIANGQCLCGDVKVRAQAASNKVHACHCETCRRWTGGPLLAIDCETQVEFEGQSNISSYDSSQWAQRGFCKNCGTHLYYRLKQSGQYMMPVGLFDDLKNIEFDGQVFVDEKPHYYDFANKTQMLTGEQLFAMFHDQQL